jgi:tetratricopeptide (TPR) repeat protein
MSLQTLGRVRLAKGDLPGAAAQAELARALATGAQDRWAAECHDLFGAIQALRAEWDAAEWSYDQALLIRDRVGHAAGLADSLVGLGLVHDRRGNWPRADDLYRRALDVATAMDPGPQAVAAYRQLGRLCLRRGELEAASQHIEQALRRAEAIPHSLEYGPTLLAMSELESARSGAAVDHAERTGGRGWPRRGVPGRSARRRRELPPGRRAQRGRRPARHPSP